MRKKAQQTDVLNSVRWCNGFACRNLLCGHHPNNIPKKYKNSSFRYVDSSNFSSCTRWEEVARRRAEKEKGEGHEDQHT